MENKDNELSDFFEDDETYETITLTDEDGIETDFVVIDAIENNKTKYLLVVSAKDVDLDEPEAAILKEINSDNKFSYYEFVENDDEFKKVSVLFHDNETDYEMNF